MPVMEYRRTYEGCQLDPGELAELEQQRQAEAQAEARADWERAQSDPVLCHKAGAWNRRPVQRPELPEYRASPIPPHPTSRRNGSGFTGIRLRGRLS